MEDKTIRIVGTMVGWDYGGGGGWCQVRAGAIQGTQLLTDIQLR